MLERAKETREAKEKEISELRAQVEQLMAAHAPSSSGENNPPALGDVDGAQDPLLPVATARPRGQLQVTTTLRPPTIDRFSARAERQICVASPKAFDLLFQFGRLFVGGRQ